MKTQQRITLPNWEVGIALRDLYDLFERIMHNGILIGDAAYQIKVEGRDGFSQHLDVDKIEWAMPVKNLTPEVKSLFKSWGFSQDEDGNYGYNVGVVPFKIRVIKGKYKFFENPDIKFYGVDEFRLPNPFDKYWRVRNLIK